MDVKTMNILYYTLGKRNLIELYSIKMLRDIQHDLKVTHEETNKSKNLKLTC